MPAIPACDISAAYPGHSFELPYQVETAGQSLSIRARTPGVNPMRSFEEEEDKVEAGLIATRDLLAWIRANAGEIARLLDIP